MQKQFWPDNDHRTARIINAFAQQILTEAALLSLQHIGERFQWSLVGAGYHAPPAAIVEQSVNRFLQHPFFIPDDNIGCAQFDEAFQTIVPVDNPAVQIVQIRRGEPAAVQRHQRAQFRWDNRHDVENHPFRSRVRFDKRFNQLQPLDVFFSLGFRPSFLQVNANGFKFFFKLQRPQHVLDRLRANLGGEILRAVFVLGVDKIFFRQ